jgi:CheY-like chemotaxis protein
MELLTLRSVCEPFAAPIGLPLTALLRCASLRTNLGHCNVLIVDDNAIDQLRAMVVTNDLGATVEVVNSGKQALAVLEESQEVCLVLMDCDMPEMSGLEATQRWRRVECGWRSAIPIVGVSPRGAADRARCLAAGMNDCLRKPLDRDDVRRCLEFWTPAARSIEEQRLPTVSHED